jgi:hypothetical protein
MTGQESVRYRARVAARRRSDHTVKFHAIEVASDNT